MAETLHRFIGYIVLILVLLSGAIQPAHAH